ncbi:MAG TPA: class I SAM-dependent methyltransferase [Flavisolibacter sp.]|nr:class I SAM-dependent methyltransferase [Flavisolibacter sp.]
MMDNVHYSSCPVCGSKEINPLLTVKDYTVSKEEFVIWHCIRCTLRFTQDVPNEASIGRYYNSENYISHSDTDKGLINRIYKQVRKKTLQQKAVLMGESTGKAKGRLLDVGCGTGAFLGTMKDHSWEVQGLEPDPDARALAQKLYNVPVEAPDQLFNLQAGAFDAITLWHVLEHVHQLHEYIAQLKKLLAPGGKIFIAVPNYTSLDADIYRLHWAAYDVPRHLYHFTPASIQVLVEAHGLKLVAKRPMWFDSFYISMLSSKYRHGNTSYVAPVINGLRSNLKALGNPDRCSSLVYIVSGG